MFPKMQDIDTGLERNFLKESQKRKLKSVRHLLKLSPKSKLPQKESTNLT